MQLGGPWAQQLPDPPLQGRYSRIVAQAKDADANPHLARDRHGRVWFVPKAAIVAPVGLLLPAQVNAILADPDTIIRLGVAHRHTGAVDMLDERTYRPGAKLARLVRARDGTCRYPGCATPAATVRPGPCHRLPGRCHVGGQPADVMSNPSRVQAPRRLDRQHDPRGRVHLDRPQRPHPHHPPHRPPRRRRLRSCPRWAPPGRTAPRPAACRCWPRSPGPGLRPLLRGSAGPAAPAAAGAAGRGRVARAALPAPRDSHSRLRCPATNPAAPLAHRRRPFFAYPPWRRLRSRANPAAACPSSSALAAATRAPRAV